MGDIMLVNNICYDLCGLVFSLFVITIMLYKKTSVKTLDEKIFVVQITTSLLFGLSCIFYYITLPVKCQRKSHFPPIRLTFSARYGIMNIVQFNI